MNQSTTLCGQFLAAAAFFAVIFLSAFSGVVSAEQRDLQTDKTEKIDAVLVLDTSGSMLQTDPQRLRDEGAHLFIQFLKPGDNLGIIDFSDEAKIVRPLTPYDATQSEAVTQLINGMQTEGQYTDILQGLERAREVLDTSGRNDAKPVIVLLSDGKMDPNPQRGSGIVLTQQLLEEVLPDMKSKGRKVYTLALSGEADKDLLQQIAAGTDAVHWVAPTADQIHQSYAQLFLAVKKPQVIPLSDKGFNIDDNVSEATFYVNRAAEGEVKVQHPNGQVFTAADHPQNVKWYSSPKFEVITIEKPEVGTWHVAGVTQDEGFATILTNLKLVTDWGNSIEAGEEALLQARLYESEKPIALPEMTGLIRYAFQITPTDRVAEPLERDFLADDGKNGDKISNDGIFSHFISVEEPGEYVLRIIAKAPTFERQQQIPFRVKPPFITLRIEEVAASEGEAKVEGATESKSDSHGEGAVHGGEKHGEDKAEGAEGGGKSEAHGEAVSAHDGIYPGDEHARVVVELNDEMKNLKNAEVQLAAIDDQHRKLIIPVEKAGDSGRIYEATAALLPADGVYELRATVTGEGRGKASVRQSSRPLKFKRSSTGGAPAEIKLVAPEEKKPDGFPFVGLILEILIIAGVGAAAIVMVRKSQGGEVKVDIQAQPVKPEVLAAVADLEQRAAKTEVDVNDPAFEEQAASAA